MGVNAIYTPPSVREVNASESIIALSHQKNVIIRGDYEFS